MNRLSAASQARKGGNSPNLYISSLNCNFQFTSSCPKFYIAPYEQFISGWQSLKLERSYMARSLHFKLSWRSKLTRLLHFKLEWSFLYSAI